jgi:transcriptional regulator with XRE-family HTH domain
MESAQKSCQGTLGKKLKEARLAKKLTQSDVVGTFITRNMLSQIESGVASPSLRTLEYLAHTLEIPIHYLISEEQDLPADTESPITLSETKITERIINPELYGLILSLKALYDSKQYDKLGEILNELLSKADIKGAG